MQSKFIFVQFSFRVISESVSYIESMLNQAYERNAVLESEVDEIENLRIRLQRATDEARGMSKKKSSIILLFIIFKLLG